MSDADNNKCQLCGEPMPAGEESFMFHGYSGPCPKPPIKRLGHLYAGVNKSACGLSMRDHPNDAITFNPEHVTCEKCRELIPVTAEKFITDQLRRATPEEADNKAVVTVNELPAVIQCPCCGLHVTVQSGEQLFESMQRAWIKPHTPS